MAWAKKKSGGRREPQFGLAASLAELRLGPKDRATAEDAAPRKKRSAKAAAADDDEAPRERKPRAAGDGGKRRSKTRPRGGLYRLFYWGAVLGLWGAIALVGVI